MVGPLAVELTNIRCDRSLFSNFIHVAGVSGELNPTKSIVFAAAEVFFCILIRKFPSLNPALKSISLYPSPSTNQPANIQLAAATITTLPHLLSLCSHRGTLSVFPVILHILLTSLRQLVDDNISPSDPRSLAVIQCLGSLSKSPYLESPVIGKEWEASLRSTVLRLTDIAKSILSEKHTSESAVSVMIAVSVILLSAPERVSRVENVSFPCINMFRQFLDSRNSVNIQVEALQTLGQIFYHPNRIVAGIYIRHLAPDILSSLDHKIHKLDLKNGDDVVLIIEKLKLLESVVEAAKDGQRDKILTYVAPVFIEFLQEPGVAKSSELSTRLHAFCLGRLQRMAPVNPEGFRDAVARNPESRKKLELALSASNMALKASIAANSTPKTARRGQAGGVEQPSIKLKMDFSNFSA